MTSFLKGTFASRPSAASNPDSFYWANDLPTGEDLFFSDGNTWVEMAEQPFEPLERSAISQVQGLTEALANFALEDHDHVWAEVTGKPATFPPEAHGHGIADVTGLQAGLDSKAAGSHTHAELPTPGQKNALDGSQGTPGANNRFLTETDPSRIDARAPTAHTHPWDTGVTGKPSTFPPATHAHPTSEVTGLDAALAAKVASNDNRLSDARTPTAHTHPQSDVTNLTTDLAAKANVARVPNASYRAILDSTGSHIAARVAGTYGMAQGQPLAISGTGTLYALNTIYLAAADYPTVDGIATKLRIRAQLYVNDVAPTGSYTVGLHPITRPATSGGAGLLIYTIGAAVAGSTVAQATPAADSSNILTGTDFALPADGHYVIGVVTTATVATSSLVHISSLLQMRNA